MASRRDRAALRLLSLARSLANQRALAGWLARGFFVEFCLAEVGGDAEELTLERLISMLHADGLAPSNLPEHVVRYAQDQVDAGRFATIEDVLSAGVEALQERDQADQDWLADARLEAESGFAALDRGEGIRGTVDEHMSRIDAAVRARVAARAGK